jgi:hypothetical protein
MPMMIRPTDDPKPLTIQLRVSQEFLDTIDDWRANLRPVLSRSEAIRTAALLAIGRGLKAKPKPK